MKTCDLHCHSFFSDGTFSPGELIELAESSGLSALALTDHNTTRGLYEFLEAGENSSVTAIPGCEFSTEFEDKEVHVVGLFLPKKSWIDVEVYVDEMHRRKRESNVDLIKNLIAAGYEISVEEVEETTNSSVINRAHVAAVLFRKGYVSSRKEAFDTLLKEGKGYYTHAKRLDTLTTIEFIKKINGVAIIAHPFLNFDEDRLRRFLPLAKECGLDAIETDYTEFTPVQTALAKEIAYSFGLLKSGGSDFHGENKPDILLGVGRGNLSIPFEYYEKLSDRSKGFC